MGATATAGVPGYGRHNCRNGGADLLDLDVTVCTYPTGASKGNPVEHRLFDPISVN